MVYEIPGLPHLNSAKSLSPCLYFSVAYSSQASFLTLRPLTFFDRYMGSYNVRTNGYILASWMCHIAHTPPSVSKKADHLSGCFFDQQAI